MKKIFGVYIGAVLLILLGSFLYVFHFSEPDARVDNTAVNDIVMTAKENWTEPEKAGALAEKENFDCAVLNEKETLLYRKGKGTVRVAEAVQEKAIVVPIVEQSTLKGYVILSDKNIQAETQYREKMMALIIVLTVLLLVSTLIYIFFLYRRIMKPFDKLKHFAGLIAQGNLEVPLEMDRGNIFGAFTESFDIMREELEQARQREYRAEQSKKELIASLSHDIKTPVASIRSAVELLQVTTENEKEKEKLRGIESKSDQIELLINNLFHATLEELQELEVKPEEESSALLGTLIHSSDYSGLVEPFTIPECLIICDRLRLGQVIDNVISNSYKYADTPIYITGKILDNALFVSIRDEGETLSAEDLHCCTDKFYRGKNGAGKNGAGLGLYISTYFMTKMGGGLEIQGERGFEVQLYFALA